MKISGTYKPTKWDEKPYDIIEERMKATKASIEFAFAGDIEGVANVEYLMFYPSFDAKDPHKSQAQFVGLIRVVGKLKGKAGSFVMSDNGTFKAGAVQSKISIIANSGTGELASISGSGWHKADQSGCAYELEVSI